MRGFATVVIALATMGAACSAATEGGSDSAVPTDATATPAPEAAVSESADDDGPDPTDPHDETAGSRPPVVPLQWQSCGAGVECSALTVPLDANLPDGTTIDIALVRRPTPGGDPLGTLVLNPGGPGGSGVDWLMAGSPLPPEVTERFDLVSWDPRGVGRSAPLGCAGRFDEFYALDSTPDDAAEQATLDETARAIGDDCEAAAGDLLPHVGTDATIHDLEAIRVALGDNPLRYVGFSYGTFIGLHYLDAYPDHVASMVLDGVVDPTLDRAQFLTDQTLAFDRVLGEVLTSCLDLEPCPVNDPMVTVDDLVSAVEDQPLRAGDGSAIGPAEVTDALLVSAYSPTLQVDLLEALADAEEGNIDGIDRLADTFRSFTGWDAYTATSCIDAPGLDTPERFRRFATELGTASPLLGGAVANELLPCATWPTTPIPVTATITGEDGPPVLLIGGTGDPATPLTWAEDVHDMLVDDVLIIYDGPGHTAIGRDVCVDDFVASYLLDGTLPANDPLCG